MCVMHIPCRVQADGLEIEAAAKRRLADEYDAAQAAGELRAAHNKKTGSQQEPVLAKDVGLTKTVPSENGFKPATSANVGLTRKEVHDARQFRDAEARDPGELQELSRSPAIRRRVRLFGNRSFPCISGNQTVTNSSRLAPNYLQSDRRPFSQGVVGANEGTQQGSPQENPDGS